MSIGLRSTNAVLSLEGLCLEETAVMYMSQLSVYISKA